MKVLVIGAGYIASHLDYEILNARVFPDREYIYNLLTYHKPDVIINCIGKTGTPNIDWCETNKEQTLESNLTIPTMLASECNKLGIRFIHIGSGCLFYRESPNIKFGLNGTRTDLGWSETDTPQLQNASFYSKIKYAADLAIGNLPNSCILRIRMPISWQNHPRNLINKLLKYENVIDIPNSVTFLQTLQSCIDWVIKNNQIGIFNLTNPQPLSAVDIIKEYQKYNPNHKFNVISEEELDKITLAKRSNCLLNCDKIQKAGFQIEPTEELLKETFKMYIQNLG